MTPKKTVRLVVCSNYREDLAVVARLDWGKSGENPGAVPQR